MADSGDMDGGAGPAPRAGGERPSGPASPDGAQARAEIMRWRKGERTRLIEARLDLPASRREEMARAIAEHLDAILGDPGGRRASLYWPFRGEPDLRRWATRFIGRGGRVALPVVIAKGQPLVFRDWRPGDRLEKGIWNIPVPAEGPAVAPDIVIAPLVGFDPQKYRLGYGGGFFDRTLAALSRRPLAIGVGYRLGRLASIFPLGHDIAMDRIVTEEGEQPAAA